MLDERAESELIDRATFAVLLEAARAPGTPLADALATAIASAADLTFREVVRELLARRDAVTRWIGKAGGVDKAVDELARALGIDPTDDLARLDAELVDGPLLPSSQWLAVATLCEEGSASDCERAAQLRAAFAASGPARIADYFSIFLTGDWQPRKNLITRPLGQRRPALAERLALEQQRVVALHARRNAVICRDRTAALLAIGATVIARYRAEKEARGLLDYDDLIAKTLRLLETVNPTWVHYKLDRGIDHVLIDEAQDTSEPQWAIISRLVAEFAAGAGARDANRTIFAVGDEKQSIFSFQGAVPRKFDEMRRHFETDFSATGLGWRTVRFIHSFRSGANVLGAVNEVFRTRAVYAGVTTDEAGIAPHEWLPDAGPGLVEIWPLTRPDERREIEGWDAPFDAVSQTSPQVRLAQRIAATIADGIRAGEPLGRTRKPMTAGDVLVLVRQRG
ncbi:MAG TPA: UvrD-helicase domain-containing protein, partial [Caldimonas sp.]|nr:UvrD-helicase domain-containing protein [Caldimonas sp.]